MIAENKLNYYIGSIVGIVGNDGNPNPNEEPFTNLLKDHKSQEYIAVVTVPGLFENIIAYPGRNQIDEPKIGDLVVIAVWDPYYNSYNTYEKLKENDFVGFRSQGKMVNITHDQITIGVYDETVEYKDEEIPDTSKLAHLTIDKDGNIDIHTAKNITLNIEGDAKITASGSCTIDSKQVEITGGMLKTKGTASPDGNGPYCAIPACIFSGATHVSSTVNNT